MSQLAQYNLCTTGFRRRTFLWRSFGLTLGRSLLAGNSGRKLLTDSPFAYQLTIYYRPSKTRNSPDAWDESYPGAPAAHPGSKSSQPATSKAKIVVEWSSAPPVKQERERQAQVLPIPPANDHYVISVLQLPGPVNNLSANLLCSGRRQLIAVHIKQQVLSGAKFASCYFSSADPFTKQDNILFSFSADEMALTVRFIASQMVTSAGVLALL